MYYSYHFYSEVGALVRTGFTSDVRLRRRKLQRHWPGGYLRVECEFDSWMDALDWENRMRRSGYPTETPHNPVSPKGRERVDGRR